MKNFKEKPAGKRVAVYKFFIKVKMHAGIYCAHDLMFRVKNEFPKINCTTIGQLNRLQDEV